MPEQIELSKTLLVVFALSELGGEADLEHIAVKAFELFPHQFGWRSFPAYPDKDVVRVHLSDAKKKAAGVLVTDRDLRFAKRGSSGYLKRYALTSAGVDKARETRMQLQSLVSSGGAVISGRNNLDYRRMVLPLLESPAFAQYKMGRPIESIGRDAFFEAFKLFPDVTDFIATGRISRAAAAVEKLPADERELLSRFIGEGRNAYGV